MRARGLAAALFLAALSLFLLNVDRPGLAERRASLRAIGNIRAGDLVPHLRFLSDDLLEGRAPSTRGGELAASYLAAQLSLLGYTPAGDNGTYFQRVPVIESVIEPESSVRIGEVPLKFSSEIVAFSNLTDRRIDVTGDVVFVGHGIVAPEYAWDDYAGADVAGKIALVMVNEPKATAAQPMLFAGDELTYYGRWTYKFEEAARHGAVGVLLIHTEESATYPWTVVQTSWGGAQYSLPPTPGEPSLALKAWVSDDAARAMTRQAGQNLDDLRRAAASGTAKAVPLGLRLSATLLRSVQQKAASNVIGVLPGSDPSHGVIVTAHYDHLGVRAQVPGEAADADRVFNGAVDNASGVAGTLAIAGAFARAAMPPTRSIYVMFTTAEESGLLGSDYFASHPVLPVQAWAANVNIDELNVFGRARDLVLVGAERSSLREVATGIASRLGREIALDPDPGQGNFFRSDHFPLAKAGIPAVSLGLPTQFIGPDRAAALARRNAFNERDYHQASDEMRPDWNYEGAIDDLRLLGGLVWTIANDPAMPSYHADDPFARSRRTAVTR